MSCRPLVIASCILSLSHISLFLASDNLYTSVEFCYWITSSNKKELTFTGAVTTA